MKFWVGGGGGVEWVCNQPFYTRICPLIYSYMKVYLYLRLITNRHCLHKQHDRSERDRDDLEDREDSRSRYQRRDRDSEDKKWMDSRQDEPTSVVILHGLDKDLKEEDVS